MLTKFEYRILRTIRKREQDGTDRHLEDMIIDKPEKFGRAYDNLLALDFIEWVGYEISKTGKGRYRLTFQGRVALAAYEGNEHAKTEKRTTGMAAPSGRYEPVPSFASYDDQN
uniref:Uncharacterized protein n=1 Tax=viral metagenome TaxID=1070528 RepID=A0A6M3J0U1_9ZZZZ